MTTKAQIHQVNVLAMDWNRERKFGDLCDTQCPTIFHVSRHRCGGIYGHDGCCQDINYPKDSKDLGKLDLRRIIT